MSVDHQFVRFFSSCLFVVVCLIFIWIVPKLQIFKENDNWRIIVNYYEVHSQPTENYVNEQEVIQEDCQLTIVESIPEKLTYPPDSFQSVSTYDAWARLIDKAKSNISVATYYWTLSPQDTPSSFLPNDTVYGETILKKLKDKSKSLKLRLIHDDSSKRSTFNKELRELSEMETVEIRKFNMTHYLNTGILHTKLWIVDDEHFYVGSANNDWRSLSQVKELGLLAENCKTLTNDINKIFEQYWFLAIDTNSTTYPELPQVWNEKYYTPFNYNNQNKQQFNGSDRSSIYISSSPPPLVPGTGRNDDITALVTTVGDAEKFIHIAVMSYDEAIIFDRETGFTFWPVIHDAIIAAAIDHKVQVKLLMSKWAHTSNDMIIYLKNLASLHHLRHQVQIEVKLFNVPCYDMIQCQIPFARVNHNKYLVTDKTAYIGTSNWSGDYFTSTGGISVVATNETSHLVNNLQKIFDRDWFSEHAKFIHDY
ncbi:hypothetical protein SNEBB_009045 [Seison nebaliae]|nr:hypothetical protein SNEBB_009045 [Seison nebaliae]